MGVAEIVSLLCGVALFLFGMSLMGDGLKRVSGNKLEPVLYRLTGTPLRGMVLGAGVTAVIQSSSATSVMAVGFVNSGMMRVRQAISVILGALLGTSITGWVVCLSYIEGASGLKSLVSSATLTGSVAVAGIILRMFSKKRQRQHLGDILLGFAVLMVGMSTMSGSVSGLGDRPWFTSMISSMSNPLAGILVGTVFAAILQSASAAVGIVQALSVTGAMTLEAALPLLLGINIGASLPVLLSALGAGVDGKRTALSYLVASTVGVMVCASLFYIADAIFRFAFMDMVMDPVSLALVNTLFRLVMILLLAPFTDVLEALVELMVPAAAVKEDDPALRLEERFLAHPALAIEQSRRTIFDMSVKAEEAVTKAIALLDEYSEDGVEEVKALEALGDRYEDALGSYLARLTGRELMEQQSREVSIILHTLSDFERISDHARNIAESAAEIHDKQIHFSEASVQEGTVLTNAVLEILHMAGEAFRNGDLDAAVRVEPLEIVVDELCDEVKLRHVDRLQQGLCTIENGFVLNDLVTNFERVSDHCSNIAVAMIELDEGAFDTHRYLSRVREKSSPEFHRACEEFRTRFAL